MQTIEEYKAYTRQLENEVGKWHHAYDALMIERNQMEKTLCENKKIIETMAAELDELRKHEVEWDLSKARIKELEQEIDGLKIKNGIIQKSHDATVQEFNDLINNINGGK